MSRLDVPLFISHNRLARYKHLPVARTRWALDSGAFSELSRHGAWRLSPRDYIAAVRRYRDEIGKLAWASPQDWMCEPPIIKKTGLSVREHQRRTVENFITLRSLAPDLPFIPVLQGWTLADYLSCIRMYQQRGIDLRAEPLVGLGSVCRRQAADEIGQIVRTLASLGIRLHGYGVKTTGLRRYGRDLASADSMAWSLRGRYAGTCRHPRTGHRPAVSEANCLVYALSWREAVLASAAGGQLGRDHAGRLIGDEELAEGLDVQSGILHHRRGGAVTDLNGGTRHEF